MVYGLDTMHMPASRRASVGRRAIAWHGTAANTVHGSVGIAHFCSSPGVSQSGLPRSCFSQHPLSAKRNIGGSTEAPQYRVPATRRAWTVEDSQMVDEEVAAVEWLSDRVCRPYLKWMVVSREGLDSHPEKGSESKTKGQNQRQRRLNI